MSTKDPIIPGNIYHLYNHANADITLFRDERNYMFFLEKFKKYVSPFVETYAYCLMPNHFHFLIRVKEAQDESILHNNDNNNTISNFDETIKPRQVTNAIKNWLISYTQSYHKAFKTRGNLYYQKIRRKVVKEESYLVNLIVYINMNPVIHGFVDCPADWYFSSYKSVFSKGQTMIKQKKILELFDDVDNFKYCHELKALNNILERIDVDF